MQPRKPLEILILGCGAVGTVFGSRAQGTRARITAVCRSNYEVAKNYGIEIRSELWGRSIFRPERVVRCSSEVAQVSYDYIVLATKSVENAAQSLMDTLRPVVRSRTTLVTAQNGVTSELELRRCGFRNPILSATCYISCRRPSLGIVEQISHVKPHAFYIGSHGGSEDTESDTELETLVSLDQSFAKVEDAPRQRWEKMVFNAAWSPSSALFEKDTHGLLQDIAGIETVRALATEAVAVGRAMGINLSESLVETTISGPASFPAIVPSMLQDLWHKRPLELEALCAVVIRYGHRCNVNTPVMQATYDALLEKDHMRSTTANRVDLPLAEPGAELRV